MTVYVEYAFLENFFVDGTLLYLSMRSVRLDIKYKRLLFSSLLGGVFALLFPLLSVSGTVATLIKIAFGALMCLIATDTKKGKSLFLLIGVFYGYSFLLAGGLLASGILFGYGLEEGTGYFLERLPMGSLLCAAMLTAYFLLRLLHVLTKKIQLSRFLYDVEIRVGKVTKRTKGYYDSGNLAQYKLFPLHFMSSTLALELFALRAKDGETQIVTLGGEERTAVYKGTAVIYCGKKGHIIENAYFAASDKLTGREYGVLLNAEALKGGEA